MDLKTTEAARDSATTRLVNSEKALTTLQSAYEQLQVCIQMSLCLIAFLDIFMAGRAGQFR